MFLRWIVRVSALAVLALMGCAGTARAPETPLVFMATEATLRCFGSTGADPVDRRPLVSALLSPRMVYSLLEWPRMRREAELLGFRVQAWRDPRVPEDEWRLVLNSRTLAAWPVSWLLVLPKDCMAQWTPINHVPLTRVMLGRQVHRWPIWGVMTSEAWRASLINRLDALKATSGAPK